MESNSDNNNEGSNEVRLVEKAYNNFVKKQKYKEKHKESAQVSRDKKKEILKLTQEALFEFKETFQNATEPMTKKFIEQFQIILNKLSLTQIGKVKKQKTENIPVTRVSSQRKNRSPKAIAILVIVLAIVYPNVTLNKTTANFEEKLPAENFEINSGLNDVIIPLEMDKPRLNDITLELQGKEIRKPDAVPVIEKPIKGKLIYLYQKKLENISNPEILFDDDQIFIERNTKKVNLQGKQMEVTVCLRKIYREFLHKKQLQCFL